MKYITVPITEHDIEMFQQLIEDGEPFYWTIGEVEMEFVSQEHKKEQLLKRLTGLKQSMKHAGVGSKDIRLLHSLENQLEDLE